MTQEERLERISTLRKELKQMQLDYLLLKDEFDSLEADYKYIRAKEK